MHVTAHRATSTSEEFKRFFKAETVSSLDMVSLLASTEETRARTRAASLCVSTYGDLDILTTGSKERFVSCTGDGRDGVSKVDFENLSSFPSTEYGERVSKNSRQKDCCKTAKNQESRLKSVELPPKHHLADEKY
eukprot:TRINITY_DN901_c0_g1_i1.p2 TRINITY_DN901_c0_g1~~TRINITY_DN901_c0_g1_i1.p2  ORF type:complete len:135 (+),score=21.00 TRINITY_DN901_c0_g1_i1:582-986(+)